MRLFERLRIQREAHAAYRKARDGGADHDSAADTVLDAMQEKYGASVDWARIVELILKLLELFAK